LGLCFSSRSFDFIEKGLYTIPEFIEKRYSTNLKTILAVFWIALFIFVNLTSVLFLGVGLSFAGRRLLMLPSSIFWRFDDGEEACGYSRALFGV